MSCLKCKISGRFVCTCQRQMQLVGTSSQDISVSVVGAQSRDVSSQLAPLSTALTAADVASSVPPAKDESVMWLDDGNVIGWWRLVRLMIGRQQLILSCDWTTAISLWCDWMMVISPSCDWTTVFSLATSAGCVMSWHSQKCDSTAAEPAKEEKWILGSHKMTKHVRGGFCEIFAH